MKKIQYVKCIDTPDWSESLTLDKTYELEYIYNTGRVRIVSDDKGFATTWPTSLFSFEGCDCIKCKCANGKAN